MSTSYRPSADYLRQCFREQDGLLFWRERPRSHFPRWKGWSGWNLRWAGKEAGYYDARISRYLVTIDGHAVFRSKIVWALYHGFWADYLDHKDVNSSNDRIDNLRVATHGQNLANTRRRSDNASGLKGVSWRRGTGKWRACIGVNGKSMSLGDFDDIEEAHAAYLRAAREYFGEFANGG